VYWPINVSVFEKLLLWPKNVVYGLSAVAGVLNHNSSAANAPILMEGIRGL
jgi:hypothetical protein